MQVLTTDIDSVWGCCLLVTRVNVLRIDYIAGRSSAAKIAAWAWSCCLKVSCLIELTLSCLSTEITLSCTRCACIAACIAGSKQPLGRLV